MFKIQNGWQIPAGVPQNGEGEWKVRNVQLQSINLGKVYRNQFASAAKQYDADIDKVIANWVKKRRYTRKPWLSTILSVMTPLGM